MPYKKPEFWSDPKADTLDDMPNADICDRCGGVIFVGDYPFCKGNRENHQPVIPMPAQMGAPTVIFQNARGNYDYPLADGRAPRGFEKRIELRNQRERDAFERQESASARLQSAAVGEGLDAIKRTTPTASVNEMKAWRDSLSTPMGKRYMDKIIEKKQAGTLGGSIKKKEGTGALKIHVNHNYVGKKKRGS